MIVWTKYVGSVWEKEITENFNRKTEVERPFQRYKCGWEDNTKIDLKEVDCNDLDWINLTYDRDKMWIFVKIVIKFWIL